MPTHGERAGVTLEVEAVGEVGAAQATTSTTRELPGTALAPGEPARDPKQRQPAGEGERALRRRPAGKQQGVSDDPAARAVGCGG